MKSKGHLKQNSWFEVFIFIFFACWRKHVLKGVISLKMTHLVEKEHKLY